MANTNARIRRLRRTALLGSVGLLACASSSTAALAVEYGVAPDVKHMALIIGNSDYDGDGTIRTGPTDVPAVGALKDLKNACSDAQLFRQKLLAARWKPEEITSPPCNLSAREMRDYITNFRTAIANATNTVVIFYFSGHGAQFSNAESSHSFLFGSGAKVDLNAAAASLQSAPGNTSFLATEAVDLHELLSTLGRQTENAVLLILDACRENPLYGQIEDLSPSLSVAPISSNLEEFPGIVVAYSTPSGQFSADGSGDHSIYTGVLSDLLRSSTNLDSVLNRLRSKVAVKYREQFPTRTGIQEPVTRGRFAGDWCVWACPPSSDSAPVAELDRGDHTAVASAHREVAVRISEDAEGPAPHFGAHRPAAALLKRAAFAQAAAIRAVPPRPEQSTVQRSVTVFDKQSLVRDSSPVFDEGMRFDIFWCDDGVGADDRAKRATNIAAALASEATANTAEQAVIPESLRKQITSVRVRALSATSNTISGYRYTDDIVVYDPGIKSELGWANSISKVTSPQLKLVGEGSMSSGYMSIFVCKAPGEYAEGRSKLYLQVPQNDQKVPGRLLLRDISEKVPTINAVEGIEFVPSSPPYTEVRFYYPEDRDNAFATAAEIETLLKRGVKVKYMSRLAAKTKPGFLEVWLGKLDPPLFVDEGGNLASKPSAAN